MYIKRYADGRAVVRSDLDMIVASGSIAACVAAVRLLQEPTTVCLIVEDNNRIVNICDIFELPVVEHETK